VLVTKSHCNAAGLVVAVEFRLRVRGTVAPAAALAEEICKEAVCPRAVPAIIPKNTPRLIIFLAEIISDLKMLI